jgi:hypothetical protein
LNEQSVNQLIKFVLLRVKLREMKHKLFIGHIKSVFTDSGALWQKVKSDDPNLKELHQEIIWPFIAMASATQLIGILLSAGFSFILTAIFTTLAHIGAIYVGIRLMAFILNKLSITFETDISREKGLQLVTFAMLPYFASTILINLHPSSLYFLKLLFLYVFYLMWKGSESLIDLNENRRLAFVLLSTVLLFGIIQAVLTIFIKILPIDVIKLA